MSGALDSTIVPLALRLISQFGTTMSVEQQSTTAATDDDDTLQTTPATPTTTRGVPVLVDNYGSAMLSGVGFLNANVLSGDKRLWVPGASLTRAPTSADKVTFGGFTWRIIAVAEIWSGNRIALYDIQARRGG